MPSPIARRAFLSDPEHDHLVDLLVDARLVTSDDGIVELSHESLARAWPRLRGWLEDDADGQRILRHLSGAADSWDSMGRPDTELYRGVRLRTALEWRDRTQPALTPTEREFLDDAAYQFDAETKRARRARRRRRVLVAAVAVLVVAVAFAGLLAVRQAERAEDVAVTADARGAAALAMDADAVDQALLLGVEAVGIQDSSDTRAALLAALLRSPALIASYHYDDVSPASESRPRREPGRRDPHCRRRVDGRGARCRHARSRSQLDSPPSAPCTGPTASNSQCPLRARAHHVERRHVRCAS